MEEIVSVSVYKEFSSIMGDITEKKKEIFDPKHVRTPPQTPAVSFFIFIFRRTIIEDHFNKLENHLVFHQ